MKKFPKRHLLLIILLGLSNLAVPLTYAGNKAKGQAIPTRTVRVTTGVEAVQGWEQGLVRTNPNLARWHWDPIYSYKQGYTKLPLQSAKPDTAKTLPGRMNRQTIGKPNQAAFNYPIEKRPDDRPGHIPFSPQAMEEVRARYSQPKESQAPIAEPSHEERVAGQLSQHPKEEPAGEPITATYGQLYSRKENLDTALKYNSQRTSVYGQLLNPNEKTSYNGAKPKRAKIRKSETRATQRLKREAKGQKR